MKHPICLSSSVKLNRLDRKEQYLWEMCSLFSDIPRSALRDRELFAVAKHCLFVMFTTALCIAVWSHRVSALSVLRRGSREQGERDRG